jgi:magnesium transporter
MNFEAMPELHWRLGYPLAITLMVGVCGYLFNRFRQAGWL